MCDNMKTRKRVKKDDKGRIMVNYFDNLKEVEEVGLQKNAVSGLVYDPDISRDTLIDSLKNHIDHLEIEKQAETDKETNEEETEDSKHE